MEVVVQKYGGSSLKDPACIQRVADRIVKTREEGCNVVAVVSAMGNTTDELLTLSRAITSTPSARELDMLLTVGERITMALLSMAIHGRGHNAVSFTGSQSGIITNTSHAGAQVIEVRPYRIQDEIADGKIVIVAGYQGVSYRREITTLGRGGSDTTAIALAAALDAKYCEICSDVDGVFTADPRIVEDAQRIDQMTFDEMVELADGGARVLNADAIAYARRHGIAIYARSTFGGPKETGTLIRKDLDIARPDITAVTGRTDIVQMTVPASSIQEAMEITRALDSQVDEGDPLPLEATIGDGPSPCAVFLFATENAADAEGLPKRLKEIYPNSVVNTAWGSVTVVGPDIGVRSELLQRCTEALGKTNEKIFHQSIQRGRLRWLLPAAEVNKATQRLHNALISTD